MKKLISLMLALAMVFSMAIAVSAEAQQDTAASFSKKYTVTNGTTPAEIFNFTVAYESYRNNKGEVDDTMTAEKAPTVILGTAEFASLSATSSKDVSVTIGEVTDAALGVYTYKITENAGTTAGVTYNSDPVYLVLTVLRDEESKNHYVAAIHYETVGGEKTGEIENSYNAGQLTVTKQIEGNMADMTKKFEFTVVFTPAAGTEFDTSVQIANDNATTSRTYEATLNEDGTYTVVFELGDGETATFTNIPVGTTYTISEDEDGYTKEQTKEADGSITGGDSDVEEWTNTLTTNVDTGIITDSAPYILLIAVCAVAAVLFVTKRRAVEF